MYCATTEAEQPLGPPVRRRRWSLHPRSFRALVAAWNTLTILLFTVAILIGLRYGLSYMMIREEDQLLDEDAAEMFLLMDQIGPNWDHVKVVLDRKANSHKARQWFGQVRGRDGAILAQSSNMPDIAFPVTKGAQTTQTIGSFRVTQGKYKMKGTGTLFVSVGASTNAVADDLGRLTQLIVVAGAFLLILAPLGGFWLAGRVIRPLSNMIAKTSQLRPRNLGERLPIRDTGDELDQLSTTINSLLDRIADYLERHRELTANVAHELRSPIAAILGCAEVALNHERSADEYKELLGSIIEEGTRLGKLVQQLLMLAESDAGRLNRANEPVALDRLVLKAVDMFRGVAESRGIILEARVPGPVVVFGDAGQLRQVIQNLVDNAIKFTAVGAVHVEVRSDADGNALLIVTDTGVGIPEENLPHIFDRFYRGDQSRTRLAAGGSGLGLSICRALVATHGGTISVKSEVGRGTEVRVVLPASALLDGEQAALRMKQFATVS